jgi:hypothetical protein
MTLTNEQMIAGRFLRTHKGRKLFNHIQATFATGLRVQISTYTKATLYGPKHAGMFKLAKNGDVFVQRGKNWDCINHSGFSFERFA